MQFSHAVIITIEKGEKVLRQITLIKAVERAHNAKIHRDILTVIGDKNIAGMHVRMKKTVVEYLGEENDHSPFRQGFQINAAPHQFINVADRRAGNTLQHHDVLARMRPVNLGNINQFRVFKIASQL